MSKVTDGSYGSHGIPVGSDWVVGVKASGPAVKELLLSDMRQFTNMAHVTGTDANTTMAVNTLYVVDMSVWATADRTYTLPATAAVGDMIGIVITAGDASHELLITAASGDTLNGVSGGTEWSRLFITSEVVIMRCTVANSTWMVVQDGRKFESCRIDTDGTTATHVFGSTKISAELATVTSNPQSIWDATNKRLTPRRLGRYLIHGHLQMADMAISKTCVAQIFKNGSTNIGGGVTATTVAALAYPEVDVLLFYDATTIGDYFELFVYNGDSTTRSTNNANIYFEATRIGDVT